MGSIRALVGFSTIALLVAGVPAPAAEPAAAAAAAPGPRTSIDLTNGWRFRFGDQPATVTGTTFEDGAWEAVSLPHTWNRLGEYSQKRSAATNNAQGIGWYRLSFDSAAAQKGRRRVIQFDGVGNIAEVWLNGVRIGEHRGAFSRFRFDVTDALKPGRNLLVVKADNSKPARGSSTEHVIPLAGDFFIHGGIYRGVSLIEVDDAHIDLLDHGGPGVYATAAVTGDAADVQVLTRLRNSGGEARKLTLATSIHDASGKVVASTVEPVRLTAAGAGETRQRVQLANPRLWNGRADPYLYQVAVELRDGRRTIDRVVQPLGIRSFSVNADKGFFLNGRQLPLHGVSRHQDREGKGWALTDADHAEDMALIAEMGANTVRFAHYQHAEEWFDLADRAGMIVWAEVPFVNAAAFGQEEAGPELTANAREQLVELIRQNYNHPSVVTWSVGNEIDIGITFSNTAPPPRSLSLLQNLNTLAKQEDPTRPTVFADCCEDSLFGDPAARQKLAGTTDLIGYNRYFGWYYAKAADIGPALDRFRAKHPGLPISVSEFGAGGAFTQHSDNPLGGPINAFGRPHPEEYQSWYHEESWKQIKARPYVWASWIWNMFDFSSDLREEGEAIDLNDKGLVSFDRKRKKDAFYFYKANWSDEPVVHITGRRYVERAYPVTEVRVYSNAPSVTLTVNGKSLGAVPCSDRICVARDVTLTPGQNLIEARAVHDGRPVADNVTWNAPDAAKGLAIDAGDLAGHVGPDGTRFGSDNFFSGGEAKLLNVAGFGPNRGAAAKAVANATDPALYNGYREGSFVYELPLPDGQWRVVIHSFEPDAAQAATRSFAVSADGRRVLDQFRPASAAGGALRAVSRSFPVTVRNGRLRLSFEAQGGPAILSAITVEPK